ncbi:SagB/ThcOx family dehydrogenase [Halorussus sp. MSC15.2]|uniref:SagB/ThcOx family dehydrogenase n=1 Tax=Halorussus sp. MSC15.2 TaxID=2283638 RepID=UPI0013D46044|nr:SagB/ThcOx family dehydrogenase [Halorussus sp. MSC15.2]NEU55568.1 SagB/ThcOx family dehydrogenase [Halorussus sp. MSC15.2]
MRVTEARWDTTRIITGLVFPIRININATRQNIDSMKISGEAEELSELRRQVYNRKRSLSDEPFVTTFRQRTFDSPDLAGVFHENTKTDRQWQRRTRKNSNELKGQLHAAAAEVDPDYPGQELLPLPDDVSLDADIGTVLQRRRSVRSHAPSPVSRRDLARVLRYGAGVSTIDEGKRKRTYPSPGALYPTEIYVAALRTDDIDEGLYYYNARRHALRVLRRDDPEEIRRDVLGGFRSGKTNDARSFDDVPLVVLLTGSFWRVKFKYGPRGYRYVLQESGHLAQNLLLAAEADGLVGFPYSAFDDEHMNDLLNVDGVNEATLYTVLLGHEAGGVRDE